MKCKNCQHDKKCTIQKKFPSIVGCDGYSEPRKPNSDEIFCVCCKNMVKKDHAFVLKLDPTKGICFDCY